MRVVIDIIETVTGSIQRIIGLIVLLILGCGLIFGLGTTYIVSSATKDFAEGAKVGGVRKVEAKRQAEREKVLAQEGWGFESDDRSDSRSRSGSRSHSGERDDWGSGS